MHLDPTLSPAALIALVVGSLVVVPVLAWRSAPDLRQPLRLTLLVLRLLVLALLLLILLNPVAPQPAAGRRQQGLTVFLVDTSESMRVGTPKTRLQQVGDAVEAVLSDPSLGRQVIVASFDWELHLPAAGQDHQAMPTDAAGPLTHLGQALNDLVATTGPQGVRDLVVLSDGRAHDRDLVGEAARQARRQGVRVSTFLAGRHQTVANLALRHVFLDRQVPPRALVTLRAVVAVDGTPGKPVRLTLRSADGTVAAETAWEARAGLHEQVLEFRAGDASADFTLDLEPLPGELTPLDNRFAFRLEVSDPTIRVLYLEGSNHRDTVWNRWEYDYIPTALEETGTITVEALTVDEQLASGGRLVNARGSLQAFPATREALARYDLVICSDVNRALFTPEQLEWTADLVARRGAGFCMIGGYTAFGAGGWDRTAWERLIPVDMSGLEQGQVSETFTPEFPQTSRNHAILQFDADPDRNTRILSLHPPFRGTNLVNRAKPGATVLALHPGRAMPVIAVQAYGRGRSMAFTSDAAGGWGDLYQTRWGEGDKDNRYYRRFWVNTVRWLTENSLARYRQEILGETEMANYRPGETIRVRAWRPVPGEAGETGALRLTGRLDLEGAPPADLRFHPDTQDWHGEVPVPESLTATTATLILTAEAAGRTVGEDRLPVRLLPLGRELADLTPDADLMAQLARATGGTALAAPDELRDLLRRAATVETQDQDRYQVPLWDRPWIWGLIMALLTADWLLRKLARGGAWTRASGA